MANPTIVVVHGFAGNPREIDPLLVKLQEYGYTVICPLLAGHENRKSLKTVNYQDWIESVEKELTKLDPPGKLILIGFSMGGLICIHLASKYKVDYLITVNTPVYFWNVKRIILNLVNDFRTRDFRSLRYYWNSSTKTPLKALLNFTMLLKNTKPLFSKINVPVLILQGKLDDTAHPASAAYLIKKVATSDKKMIYYKKSGHQIFYGQEKDKVVNDIMEQLKRI